MKSKVLPALCAWALLCARAADAREHPTEASAPPSDGAMADWVDAEPVALTPKAAQLVAAARTAAAPAPKVAAKAAPAEEEQPVADDMSGLDDEEQALQMQLKQMAPDVAKAEQPAAQPAAKLAAQPAAKLSPPPQVPSSLASAPKATHFIAKSKAKSKVKPLDEDELEDLRVKDPSAYKAYQEAKARKIQPSRPIKGSIMPEPLTLVPKASGATVEGKLPAGLGEGWLSVEMQGRMLLVQYEVGQDAGGPTAAVEQRIVLGFDPQGEAKVDYNRATGAFLLEVPGPKAPSTQLRHVAIKRT